MNDKHPTPTVEEQAAAIYTEYENMWAAKRMAWIAGHASRNSEVEELKKEISKLEGIIKENHRIASLVDKDLTEAKERIKELEGHNQAIVDTNGQLGSQC